MYEIYKTEAIILGSFPYKENDKRFLFLSPDLGLCYATARSIRLLKSRLRYVLQDLSLVELDLVKGKSGWKITNACLLKSWFVCLKKDKEFLKSIGRVKSLLNRMVDQNIEQVEIFSIFKQVFDFKEFSMIENNKVIAKNSLELELWLNIKILNQLGYIDYNKWNNKILNQPQLGEDIIDKINQNKIFFLKEINEGIQLSQL